MNGKVFIRIAALIAIAALLVFVIIKKCIPFATQTPLQYEISKVVEYNRIADSLRYISPDSSIFYFQKAIESIKNLDIVAVNPEILAKSYIGIAHTYCEIGEYTNAIKFDSLGLIIAVQKNLETEIIKAKTTIGLTYCKQSDYERAMFFYDESMILAEKTKNLELQAKIFNNRAMVYYYQGDHQKARENFTKALEIGKAIKNESLVSGGYLNLGVFYSFQSNNDTAIYFYNLAMPILNKINDKKGILICYKSIGTLYYDKSDFAKAIEYYQRSLDLAEEFGDKENMAKCTHNIAMVYVHIGDNEKATELLFKSIKIKELLNDKASLAKGYRGLGEIYYNRNEFDKAKEYFEKALNLNLEINCVYELGSNYSDLSSIYGATNKIDSSLAYGLKALEVHKKNGNTSGVSTAYLNLGLDYFARKNYSQAESYLLKALSLKTNEGDEENCAIIKHHLANNDLQIAEKEQGKAKSRLYLKAEKNALESYKIAKRLGVLPVMRDASRIVKKVYQKQGNFSEALNFSEKFNSLNDSILNKNKVEALTFAEARWNVEKKQKEIDNLENTKKLNEHIIKAKEEESKQQKAILFIVIALFITSILSATIIVLYLRKRREALYQKQLSNISALRMQVTRNTMSPHFFFNTLATLSGLTNNPEQLKNKLHSLSLLLRRTIENIDKTAITLEDELDAVKAYIDLYRDKIPGKLDVEFVINDPDALSRLIPSMILQIPVENAIKHGLMPLRGDKTLRICVSNQQGNQHLTVEDNGIGIKAAAGKSTGTGRGVKVLLQTIHLLNARNQHKIKFSINDRFLSGFETSGTLVDIEIPYNYDFAV